MALVWFATSFNFYLIQFLLVSFENEYVASSASGFSDIVAFGVSGVIFHYLGVKKTFFMSFSSATVGGLLILFYGLQHQTAWTFPVLILLAKFGIACAFNVVYVGHTSMFPTAFASTSLGFCNVIARVFSATSPLLSSLDEPIPMGLFTSISCLTMILCLFLQVGKKK